MESISDIIERKGGYTTVGELSSDSEYRKDSWMRQLSIHHKHQSNEPLDKNVYWSDEAPVYNTDKLNAINERFAIILFKMLDIMEFYEIR